MKITIIIFPNMHWALSKHRALEVSYLHPLSHCVLLDLLPQWGNKKLNQSHLLIIIKTKFGNKVCSILDHKALFLNLHCLSKRKPVLGVSFAPPLQRGPRHPTLKDSVSRGCRCYGLICPSSLVPNKNVRSFSQVTPHSPLEFCLYNTVQPQTLQGSELLNSMLRFK